MATSQLENVLDVLKLLPLILSRDLQLMYELDKEIGENEKNSEKLSSKVLQEFAEALSKAQLHKLDLNQLKELRDIQKESYLSSGEKLALAKQCRDIVVSYITRIDEDMEYITGEAPPGILESIESLSGGGSSLPSTSSMMFDETYNKYGQKGLMMGTHGHPHGQHRPAAQKGIKAPRIDALTAAGDDVITQGNNTSSSSASSNASSAGRHGGVRRKSAVYAMDSMSVALGAETESDEESSYLPSRDYQSVTNGLASTAINDVNVDMGEIQMMSNSAAEQGQAAEGDNTLYCTCRGTSYGEMVACDDDNCRIEWVCTAYNVMQCNEANQTFRSLGIADCSNDD